MRTSLRSITVAAVAGLVLVLVPGAAASAAPAPMPVRYAVSGTVNLPLVVKGITVNPATAMVYVVGQSQTTGGGRLRAMTEADPTHTMREVGLSGTLGDVAVDNRYHRLFVTDRDDNLVYVLDSRTLVLIRKIPVGLRPGYVEVDPISHTAFVSNYYGHTVSVISALTLTITATVRVGVNPGRIAIDPGRRQVYVLDTVGPIEGGTTFGASASVINEGNLSSVGTVAFGADVYDLAVDTGLHRLIGTDSNGLVVIDEVTQLVLSQIPISFSTLHLAVDSVAHVIYASNYANPFGSSPQSIAVVDEASGAILATLPSATLNDAGVVLDPATDRAFEAHDYSLNPDGSNPGGQLTVVSADSVVAAPIATNLTIADHHVSNVGGDLAWLTVTVSPVPDGGALTLLENGYPMTDSFDGTGFVTLQVDPTTGQAVFQGYQSAGSTVFRATFTGNANFAAATSTITVTY